MLPFTGYGNEKEKTEKNVSVNNFQK